MVGVSQFSAAGSTLGSVAQLGLGLLLLLRAMDDGDTVTGLSMETFDDLVIHEGETQIPMTLYQVKQHITDGGVGDMDPDLWKTLNNWIIESLSSRERLMVLTTRTPTSGSAAYALQEGPERDVAAAHQALVHAAATSKNKDLADYFARFTLIGNEAQRRLLDRTYFAGSGPAAANIGRAISDSLRKAAAPDHREALQEALLGWWHGRAMRHLTSVAKGDSTPIAIDEVEGKLWALQRQLRDNALLFDTVEIAWPTEIEVSGDDRVFVEQLRRISISSRRLGQCIYDHNRAYQQRSYWQRLNLLNIGDLQEYDEILKDEWRRHFLSFHDECDDLEDDDAICKGARQAFDKLDTSPLPPIRSEVSQRYVANGSLHILADRSLIHWHPDWLAHLRQVLTATGRSEVVA